MKKLEEFLKDQHFGKNKQGWKFENYKYLSHRMRSQSCIYFGGGEAVRMKQAGGSLEDAAAG